MCWLPCLCLGHNLLVPLQSVLEELASQEVQLIRLREKAQLLWDGHAARKGFVHRVSQLSAQYLALTNLTKVTNTCLPTCPPARGQAGGTRVGLSGVISTVKIMYIINEFPIL